MNVRYYPLCVGLQALFPNQSSHFSSSVEIDHLRSSIAVRVGCKQTKTASTIKEREEQEETHEEEKKAEENEKEGTIGKAKGNKKKEKGEKEETPKQNKIVVWLTYPTII